MVPVRAFQATTAMGDKKPAPKSAKGGKPGK
jgi:hypothetical protein